MEDNKPVDVYKILKRTDYEKEIIDIIKDITDFIKEVQDLIKAIMG